MWKNNSTKCDRCEKAINTKKDKAYCFHTETDEIYICEKCVKEVYKDFVDNDTQN